MKKTNKFFSFILSLLMLSTSLFCIPFSAYADDYVNLLKEKGFQDSYIDDLVKLHEMHPEWNFEVLNTKLDWNTALNEEYTNANQLVDYGISDWYFSDCEDCISGYDESNNPIYKIREINNWVSASKSAVGYYLDPRNFLNEQYIFQFESLAYNEIETIEGVEKILKGTWMADSNIVYKDELGTDVTFMLNDAPIKYSQAIMDAAKANGLSAYYLATKIVIENSSLDSVGVSGINAEYPGVYNYYNIGSKGKDIDALKWASYKVDDSVKRTAMATNIRQQAWISTNPSNSLGVVNAGTEVKIIAQTGKQTDGFIWYQVETNLKDGRGVSGFIRSDLIQNNNEYNRPWNNPYVSIVNGAKKLSKKVSSNQFNHYLEKFNVNNNGANSLHEFEYMANIRAAANMAKSAYIENENAKTLEKPKTFYIPVFANMPEKADNQIKNLRVYDICSNKLKYTWDEPKNVVKYEVKCINNSNGNIFSKTITSDVFKKNKGIATLSKLNKGVNYTVEIKPIIIDPNTNKLYEGQAMTIVNTTASLIGGWKNIDNEWYYYDKNSLTSSNNWYEIKGSWYYFRPNGQLSRNGVDNDTNASYHLDKKGNLIKD